MSRSDFLKLSVTLVLLVATAFVSVAAVAADGSDTIRLVKAAPASPALGGTADDWYGQGLSPAKASGAVVVSDWFERHPYTSIPAEAVADASMPSLLDNPNGRWMGPETVSAALSLLDNSNGRWIGPGTVSAALSLLDDSNGRWIGPETVSAALRQLQP